MLGKNNHLALTFDCYGTLIDWRGGLLAAVRACPAVAGRTLDGPRFLTDREAAENVIEAGAYRSYREVVASSVAVAVAHQDITLSAEEAASVGASVGRWPPFPDTAAALVALGRGRRLAIISNVERRDIERSVEQLGVSFDAIVTAEEVRSYKPAHAHFDEVLLRLDLPREQVLHVAQSLYHDILPAADIRQDAVWIDRDDAGPPAAPTYLARFTDLAGLAAALGPRPITR